MRNRTRVRIAHVRAAVTRVWGVGVAVAGVVSLRGLPAWDELPAWDRLSNELADERAAA